MAAVVRPRTAPAAAPSLPAVDAAAASTARAWAEQRRRDHARHGSVRALMRKTDSAAAREERTRIEYLVRKKTKPWWQRSDMGKTHTPASSSDASSFLTSDKAARSLQAAQKALEKRFGRMRSRARPLVRTSAMR